MRKRRSKIAWLVVIILVLLGAIYWWFWSLGNLPAEAQAKLQLVIEKGTASVIKSGSQDKQPATDGMELASGDQVMTDSGSAADVMAFDRAVTRLDESSNLTITEASLNGTSFIERWKLGAGRAWSRVLRLMDLDSVYEGQSSQVIATVRGTAFLMTSGQDKVSLVVDHAAVREAKSKNAKPEFIIGGQWINLKPTGELIDKGEASTSTLPDDIRQLINIEEDTWLKNNKEQDVQFVERTTAAIIDSLGGSKGIKPDSWLYNISGWSESWHLWLAGKKSPDLKARYVGRQLGQIYDLINRGKSGLAYQMLSQTEKDINTLLQGNQGSDYRAALKPIIGRALLGVSEVDPNSNVFRYKISMEDLYALVWEDFPAQTFYARSLSVDARLDEAERFTCELKDSDQVKEAINAVTQGMARQKNDFDKIRSGLTNNQRLILEEKMLVQGLRLDYLNKRLQACSVPGQGVEVPGATATSTQATTTQSNPTGQQTNPTSPTAPAKTTGTTTTTKTTTPTNPVTNPSTTSLGLIRIELFAQPNPANVGDKVNLYVKGYKSDGSTLDVMANAGFQVNGSLGTLSGSVYQTSKAGSVTILATVNDNGKILSSQVPLTINQTVTLSRLSIQPTNISLKPGQSQPLTVTAYYNNGFSKDVTSSVTWSLSNSLATMAGSSIVAGNSAGGVTVIATYSESGSKVSGDAFFQIMASAVTGLQ